MDIAVVGEVIRTLRHGMMPQLITNEAEVERIRRLAVEYRHACAARPIANRILLGMNIGARHYGVDVASLQGPQRKFTVARQQLMAFIYVVGHGEHGFRRIGIAFHRHHATVMHAVAKYETAMSELVG